MYGWKEKYLTLGYRSQLDIRQGRWTHLISPAVGLRRDVNDRILQRPDPDNINATWNIFGRIRFASRHTADVAVGYELARDYTPDGATLAWQLTAGLDQAAATNCTAILTPSPNRPVCSV